MIWEGSDVVALVAVVASAAVAAFALWRGKP